MKLGDRLYAIVQVDGTLIGPLRTESEVPEAVKSLSSVFPDLRVATVVLAEGPPASQSGSQSTISITIRGDDAAAVITRTDASGEGDSARRADALAKVAYDALSREVLRSFVAEAP